METRSPLQRPEPASVRPRILTVDPQESLPLDAEVLSILSARQPGVIWISGPVGSGKTSALRHLLSVIRCPAGMRIRAIDDVPADSLPSASADEWLLCATGQVGGRPGLASFELAPWSEDERIEYLLHHGADACASVMGRLAAVEDEADWLGGLPELWRPVLDAMVEEPALATTRDAARWAIGGRLASPIEADRIAAACLDSLAGRAIALPESLIGGPSSELGRWLRHAPLQIVLASEYIAGSLASHDLCAFLADPLPTPLIREAGRAIARSRGASAYLKVLLGGPPAWQAMAASLLHAMETGWRPEPGRVPRLAGARLDHARWSGVLLCKAEVEGATFQRAELEEANLDRVQANRADFRRATLADASWRDGQAADADFRRADLSAIRAEGLIAPRADMREAHLAYAILRRAQLSGADLRGAGLARADLSHADLESARVDGADLHEAHLNGANLKGLDLRQTRLDGAHLDDALLSDADLRGTILPHAHFARADLRRARLDGSIFPNADFQGANLSCACLDGVNWEGADLRGANLRGADLRGANLESARVHKADLRGAILDPHATTQLRRDGAILTHG